MPKHAALSVQVMLRTGCGNSECAVLWERGDGGGMVGGGATGRVAGREGGGLGVTGYVGNNTKHQNVSHDLKARG